MKNNTKNIRKGITAALFAAIMMVSVLAVVSPVQANTGGVLYAGGSNPGYVYKYTGGTPWEVISPDLVGYAVLDLVEYDGHLYAGIESSSGVGQVYRYDGGTIWTLVGNNMDSQVCSLAVYQDDLYAGTGWNGMNLYKYTPGTTGTIPDWTRVVHYTPWSGTRALHVSHDYLLMGGLGYDRFGRWDGTTFYADLDGGGSCIWDYEDYGDYVYASAFFGRLWQSSDGINWNVVLDYYEPDYPDMWELETFKDSLYMAYDNGELRASSVPDRGTIVYTASDGIISMTTGGDNLYFGTGGEAGYYGATSGIANVYKYDGTDGVELISGDDEFGAGVQVLYVEYHPIEVEKDYRYTNVCFEKDNDLDGEFNEDTADGIDDDLDGLIDEDPIDCPEGTFLGTLLPTDDDGDYIVEAVVHKNGKVRSYNPGQYYAVSTVKVLMDMDELTIIEDWSDCMDISARSPVQGGGSVVIVQVGPDGVAYQILDAKSDEVTVVGCTATAELEDVPAGTTILMYVKFGPAQKHSDFEAGTCVNVNSALEESASATLDLIRKE